MPALTEKPRTLIDRILALVAAAAALAGIGWLVLRVLHNPERSHTLEFLFVAGLLGLCIYLLFLVATLGAVRYTLADGVLELRQGLRRRRIDLRMVAKIHRWRNRWIWYGAVQRDLKVPEVELFPPTWVAGHAWVLVYEREDRGQRAVAFCPSNALLTEVRAWIREAQGRAD